MLKEKIFQVMREAGVPLTIEELSKQTNIEVPRLRIDLFRLMERGEVERREKNGKPAWTISVAKPISKHYEKLSRRFIS
jgi:transcription initiation factor IIE alpha subunit